jgi:peptidyl-prolyl cis-trans isomerase C
LSIVFGAALAILIAGAPLAPQSFAQDQAAEAESNPDEVVARVDGIEITRGQLDLAEDELGPDLAQLPPETRQEVVLQYVVELTLLAGAAREAGLEDTDQYKRLSRYYELRALRDVFFQQEIRENITDEAAQQLYDERIGSAQGEPEVRARHILVETEDEAKAVIQKLNDGADFAELAEEESTGPSASNGGDLGFFSKEQMVTPFAEAAFAMETGEISEPVKSRFGWHVIKVEDKRDREPPKFADVKERLKSSLIRQQLQSRMAELRGAANVEILDESLKQDEQDGGDAQ